MEESEPVTSKKGCPKLKHILLLWRLTFLVCVFLCFMFIKTKKNFTYLFHTLRNMMYGHFCVQVQSFQSGFRAVKR